MKYSIASAISIVWAASVLAASLPHSGNSMQQYHLGQVRSFGPEIQQEHYIQEKPSDFHGNSFKDPLSAALAFVASDITTSDYVVKSSYTSDHNGVTHIYLRQRVGGIEVANADININVGRSGQVLSYGNSFVRSLYKTQSTAKPFIWQKVSDGLQSITSSVQGLFNKEHRGGDYSIVNPNKPTMEPSEAVLALLSFVKKTLPNPLTVDQLSSSIDAIPVTSLQQDGSQDNYFIFDDVSFALSPIEARQSYLQLANGDLQLVWTVQLELEDHWYDAQVNAHDGTILALHDWVSESTYFNVIPFGSNDPLDSPLVLVENPHDLLASPYGWNSQGGSANAHKFNTTIGNNVYSHTNPDGGSKWEDNPRPDGTTDKDGNLVFDFKAKFDKDEPTEYSEAAVTNLFYWCNTAHDLFYRYGFDEKSGNFQQDNLGRGRDRDDGENDAVIANAQDGSGKNNANFATPPDGKHGKMRMYVWDQTNPMRDGDFESGIIIHEYTHGVSTRLTGGPKNSNCLGWGEAGGMGEGWGDFVATVIQMKKEYTRSIDFGMGGWANGGNGIRKYKYSTSMKTNPSTYRIMDRFDYWGVHAKGEVWAEMLYELYWDLVDKYGFTSEWFPPVPSNPESGNISSEDALKIKEHITSYGNTLALQLVMDGLKFQPCNPSFISARDAILAADAALTGGENYCLIYSAFARRGLGNGTKLVKEGWLDKRVESYKVPDKCT
ncbi:Fungalysin metallopeptidase-domain-containing protein [Spinellus fusiger]|nr:Fungalysin metallopeptidase-domain-containing protein [Spinellus fusiger]